MRPAFIQDATVVGIRIGQMNLQGEEKCAFPWDFTLPFGPGQTTTKGGRLTPREHHSGLWSRSHYFMLCMTQGQYSRRALSNVPNIDSYSLILTFPQRLVFNSCNLFFFFFGALASDWSGKASLILPCRHQHQTLSFSVVAPSHYGYLN